MAPLPQPYRQAYSYTAFQQGQGDNSFPGVQLDADLAGIGEAVEEITGFVGAAFRADGALTNGSVGREALAANVQLGLAPPTVWAPATGYAEDQTVTFGFALYFAQVAHTSGAAFVDDYVAGKWARIADLSTIGLVPDNSVGSAAVRDGAIVARTIATGAVTGEKIDTGAVSRDKLAANVGLLPVGVSLDYNGIALPAGFLWCDGKAYFRTGGYAPLFAALTQAFVGNVTNTGTTITGLTVDLTDAAFGGSNAFKGAVVEGFGIPAGATVVSYTATTLVLSTAATGTAAAQSFRLFPYGNGNGASTFNVPDDRDRTTVGRGDMGGTAAGRFVGAQTMSAGSALGSYGGTVTHTLDLTQIPAHPHGLNDPGHPHGTTELPHTHVYGRSGNNNSVGQTGNGPVNTNSGVADVATGGAVTNLSVSSATTGISVQSAGGGLAHNNLQPSRVVNRIIFAGV